MLVHDLSYIWNGLNIFMYWKWVLNANSWIWISKEICRFSIFVFIDEKKSHRFNFLLKSWIKILNIPFQSLHPQNSIENLIKVKQTVIIVLKSRTKNNVQQKKEFVGHHQSVMRWSSSVVKWSGTLVPDNCSSNLAILEVRNLIWQCFLFRNNGSKNKAYSLLWKPTSRDVVSQYQSKL